MNSTCNTSSGVAKSQSLIWQSRTSESKSLVNLAISSTAEDCEAIVISFTDYSLLTKDSEKEILQNSIEREKNAIEKIKSSLKFVENLISICVTDGDTSKPQFFSPIGDTECAAIYGAFTTGVTTTILIY